MDVGKRVVAAEGSTVDDALDQAANVQEADLVAQEVRNGGLVRTVGGAGGQTALADSLFAGFEAAEGLVIRRCNAQLGQRGKVQLRHGAGQALGPGQRILDGNAHVGHTELRNDRMIRKLHGGVDDALTLDDDLNLILGQTEQPRGLDQLQTLVHQGRRINRDLIKYKKY